MIREDVSERKGLEFSRVLVVGNPIQSRRHVRAWKLVGAAAKSVPPEKVPLGLHDGVCLDICSTSFPEREHLIDQSLRLGSTTIVSGAVSNKYETAQRIMKELTAKTGNARLSVLDPMKYHPLISKAVNLISNGRIGSPRILRLETLGHENVGLSDFSLFQGLLNGISCAEILLGRPKVEKVFAKKIETNYSNFYVALLTFENGSSCQLIAGHSAKEGKLEFSINGTDGMISFNESKTLELPRNVEYSDTMISASSLEVLSRMFSDFLNGDSAGSVDLSTYRLAEAIEDSSKEEKPVSI